MAKPLAVVPDLESELDELYALPPADFTRARNDLAQRLKQAGQSAISARVKELRKPTVPIWAVNQLSRRHPKDVEALLEAGEALRLAQEQALAGREPQTLRSATAAEREALRTLTQRAQELLSAEGHSPTAAVLERIAATLRAAAVDPGERERLTAGRLNEELEASGFSALEGMKVAPRPKRREVRPKPQAPAPDRRREERLHKLRDRSSKLAAEAKDAEREAKEAEATAKRVRKQAERARAAAESAREAFEEAETPTRP
jgi:hypothetical protein